MAAALPATRPNRREIVGGLAAAVALTGVGAAEAGAPSPVQLRRGISVWPWFTLTREYPPPRLDYADPPFEPGRAVPSRADLDAVAALGFDFVRIPVDPGPFAALVGTARQRLYDDVLGAVRHANAAGLCAVVNLHPNEATHHYNPGFFLGDRNGPGFALYLDVLRGMAERLASLDPARVVIEPTNEPPQSCTSPEWPLLQRDMIGAVRAAAPAVTIIATGACGGTILGLEALEPIADERVIYSFHLYEPYVFSHQGAVWMSEEPIYRYLNGVPWPATSGSRAETGLAVQRRLAADTALPVAARKRIGRELDRVLDEYFAAEPDRPFVDGFVARARAWADRHGIAPSRLLLGEFGALRTDARYVASRPADRVRYIRDMRLSAEAYGLPWCYWNLFDGFGLFASDDDRRPDPAIVAALGLRTRPR